ncbi:hypothetical protein ABZ729_10380 [Streptomyces sp. NPDC006678]|uniref:hypothetical protein n=1 Tax=Streptomyces sp. NPDC006678 TaxID=3157185 RepID=UPI0033D1CAA6
MSGSSETDVTALAVIPAGPFGVLVVTIVTPVVNRAIAPRKVARISCAVDAPMLPSVACNETAEHFLQPGARV